MPPVCASCGKPLRLSRRLSGAKTCDDCAVRERAKLDAALSEYGTALDAVINAGSSRGPAVDRLHQLEQVMTAGDRDLDDRKVGAYCSFVEHALADEILSAAEEQRLLAIGEGLFGTQHLLAAVLAPYKPRLFVAMVNDGRLPEVSTTRLMLKRGEVVHLEEEASLLREVIQREYQAGSRGVSFRIAKGVTYRVGATRGQMVEVGRSWEPEDSGFLAVTSQRMVFAGYRRTVECAFAKVVILNVFTDAIQVHVTNRQKPSTFRVPDGPMIAAAVNMAMQRLLQ